jgi:predicted nucleic acid-binding Zn ribbon protein
MKRIVLLIYLFSFLTFSQSKKADAILNQISNVKTDSIRCKLTLQLLLYTGDLNQQDKINYSKKILNLAKEKEDKVLESIITSSLAYILLNNGKSLQATELCYHALEIAENENSNFAKGFAYNVLALCDDTNDKNKYRGYLFKSLKFCKKANEKTITSAIYKNLSDSYFSEKTKDSALFYAQKALDESRKSNQHYIENFALISLGNIQYYLMNNKDIGHAYMQKALKTNYAKENPEANLYANLAVANLFKDEKVFDSALYYTNRAFVKKDKIPYASKIYVYSMYKKLYTAINNDSAVKYYQLYDVVKDSIKKMSNFEQQQLLTIKKDIEIENKEQQRKLNIQYIFIGIGILTLLVLYLLLSRNIITNPRLIKYFGILSLLIVFEFINLLVHPFLENITHHNPFLMLIALVGIAALLIPLHHRVERWAITKLIIKNKQIRLAIAKKTIEKLEDKT